MASNLPAPPVTTAERAVTQTAGEISKEAMRVEESALYSSKGHFEAAGLWNNSHLWIGVSISALSALAAVVTFSEAHRWAVIVLSLLVATLSGVSTFLNPNDKSSAHRTAGNSYDALRTKSRIFSKIGCYREGNTEAILDRALRDLCDEKHRLDQGSPQIPGWAYRSAKRGIEAGEGAYQVDKPPPGADTAQS